MSALADLCKVNRLTGAMIHVGIFEEVSAVQITEDRITVKVDRVRAKTSRSGHRITHRGITLYVYVLRPEGWGALEPITQWWSVDELHAVRVVERDAEWERLGGFNANA